MKWILVLFCSTSMSLCQTTPKKQHYPTHHKTEHVRNKHIHNDDNDAAIQAIIDSLKREH